MSLKAHIEELSEKHGALDTQIGREANRPSGNNLKIAEMKRQKLRLKEKIQKLKSD